MKVSKEPIPIEHWLIALAFGAGILIWDLMLKYIPDSIFP